MESYEKPEEILKDHGTQFFLNGNNRIRYKDKFRKYLENNNINIYWEE